MKRYKLDDLLGMPIGQVAALDPEHFYIAMAEAAEELRRAKLLKEWLESALTMKYETLSSSLRKASNMSTGTVHFDDGDYTVTTDLPKKVEWDNELLKKAIKKIEEKGDEPEEYVDITYKVSERSYAAWPNSIRALFEPARILKLGKPVISLKKKEAL